MITAIFAFILICAIALCFVGISIAISSTMTISDEVKRQAMWVDRAVIVFGVIVMVISAIMVIFGQIGTE